MLHGASEPAPEPVYEWDEQACVRLRRYNEARDAGLTVLEARIFADCGEDVGLLRRCVDGGCPVELLRLIVI